MKAFCMAALGLLLGIGTVNGRSREVSVPVKGERVTVIPRPYSHALRNPMKGFTSSKDHPWASLTHTYIKWNELEDKESDGVERILAFCDDLWRDYPTNNVKTIPRVYLHWSDDKKFWPSDMKEDDYTSEQFQKRVVRLIKRLGVCWDNDPRVAFVEIGIFGKWGEQHSPSPTPEMQRIVGQTFHEAFRNKKVSVRHMWQEFTDYPFGEYWDSWAHYEQMWLHGKQIADVNARTERYKETYIGGEVAYDWGPLEIQPGRTPTQSVVNPLHRNFVIHTIRWLHCTQLKWISNYDQSDPEARAGAEQIQKALGYRFVLNRVDFSVEGRTLDLSFEVTNEGSAPFYYRWPVEVALLDPSTLRPVWRSTMKRADIRCWMPGEDWTEPEWSGSGSWSGPYPNPRWTDSGPCQWGNPPRPVREQDRFRIKSVPTGVYVLSIAILDPAGNLPSIRFATENYIKGGRHPLGLVTLGDESHCSTLPDDFVFDDPNDDTTLYYELR